MKRISLTDKVVIGIVVFSLFSLFIGCFSYGMLYDEGLWYEIAAINNFYILFGIPFGVFFGMVLNLISLVVKHKMKITIKLNFLLFIVLLMLLPGWQHFLWQAIMSV